jgi:hypothetical protein
MSAHESLSASFGMTILVDGKSYLFEPDTFVPLSPKEAVLINLLSFHLVGLVKHPSKEVLQSFARKFLEHNNLWRHFKPVKEPDPPPMRATWL